jgi:hypothetical protein
MFSKRILMMPECPLLLPTKRSSKSAAFDELVDRECDAQNKLQVLGDDKKA